jgi:hypothetical protein
LLVNTIVSFHEPWIFHFLLVFKLFPIFLLVETIFETKLLGQLHNGIHPFWFSFGCSFNHVLLTFFASDQLFDRLKIHNYSLIDRFFMICFGDHNGRFITKILHLIFFINNGQNHNNFIDIILPHILYNPSFLSVISIWDSINYVCQCCFGIWHLYLRFSYMADLKNLCQQMFIYNFSLFSHHDFDLVMFKIQFLVVQKFN